MDYGLRDSMNMGGCMAPAACDTIARSFSDFGRTPSDYDAVFTGDLGIIGQKILLDLLEEQNIRLSPIHKDCGILIYDDPSQDTHAGGSGCGCSAVVLASYILPKIVSGEWKRILFVPTGALLSKVSFNEGDSIPGIAHGVVIEHMEDIPICVREVSQWMTTRSSVTMVQYMDRRIFIPHLHIPVTVHLQIWDLVWEEVL